MTARAIRIECDADPATVDWVRRLTGIGAGRVDLFVRQRASQAAPVLLAVSNCQFTIGQTDAERAAAATAHGLVSVLVRLAALESGLTVATLVGQSRRQRDVRIRDAVALVAREQGGLTLKQIGRALGRRDHSTINTALKRAEARRGTDPAFRLLVERLERKVGADG